MVSGIGKDISYWIFYMPERRRRNQYQSVDSSTTRDATSRRVKISIFLETPRLLSDMSMHYVTLSRRPIPFGVSVTISGVLYDRYNHEKTLTRGACCIFATTVATCRTKRVNQGPGNSACTSTHCASRMWVFDTLDYRSKCRATSCSFSCCTYVDV